MPGTRTWNEAAVRRSFMALEAEEVLKIKPSMRLENDVVGTKRIGYPRLTIMKIKTT
jgi:hypothetical protein